MRAQASFYLQRADARPVRARACARLCLLQATAAWFAFPPRPHFNSDADGKKNIKVHESALAWPLTLPLRLFEDI